jgi:hypothetical protein
MGLIKAHPFRDHFSKWPVVLQLYDGRACPECGAIVIHWQMRQAHQDWHKRQHALDKAVRQLCEAVRVLAVEAGLTVRTAADDDDDEDLDDDERLQVKVGRVLQGREYDDENDEGEGV